MKKILFLTSYSFLILSYFLIGRISTGPIRLIWISVFLMLIVCFFMDRRLLNDRVLFLYIIFFLIRIFSESFYGYSDKLFEMILTSAPSAFIVCWSSAILMKKRDLMSSYFLIPFVFIGILNAVVTICQSNGLLGTEFLVEALQAQNEDEMDYILENGDSFGRSVSGIFRTAVRNGHISLLFLLSTFLLKGGKKIYFSILFYAVILVGLFFCQQRSAFMLGIIFSTIIVSNFLFANGHKKMLVLLLILGFIIVPSVYYYIDSLDTRVTNLNLDSREGIYLNGLDYIVQHPIISSYFGFSKIAGHDSHNMILSAFIAGGLIGGSILMYILYLQLSLMYKILKRDRNHEALVIVCMYLAMISDSLFHNSGLVEINVPTLLAWGFVLGLSKRVRFKANTISAKQLAINFKSVLKK